MTDAAALDQPVGRAGAPWLLPASGRAWLFALALATVGTALSSFRIVLAPGFELYLGPFFYLLAYRIGGLRLALLSVLFTMGASYFWWGHIFSITLALCHVAMIAWLRRFRQLAAPTLLFHLLVGVPAGYVFLHFHYGAPDVIVALTVVRKLLNDVLMAAMVDLVCAVLFFDLVRGRILVRDTVRLARLMPATVTLIALTSTLVIVVHDIGRFSQDFAHARAEVALFVELDIRRANADGSGIAEGFHEVRGNRSMPDIIFASKAAPTIESKVRERLGCTRLDDGSPVTGPNDRNTFAYWISACQLGAMRVAGRDYAYFYSTRPLAESAYLDLLLDITGPAAILIIALLLQLLLTNGVERSLQAWQQVVDAFGRPGIAPPDGLLFTEFERPIGAIVAANNRFAELVDERARLADAVIELKGEMDLKLASEIRYDAAEGVLHFTEVSIDSPARKEAIIVHPSDRIALAGIASSSDAFVEFRIEGDASPDWYLLSAQGHSAPGQWRSGWIVRLRQSKLSQDRLLQQARLVELGGMASALSHELKQPLFTISLSSENGRILLDKGTPDAAAKARTKFDRIIEQVERSRDIISRISRYSRIEDDDVAPVEIREVINTALTFMRPLMVQKQVEMRVEVPDGLALRAPRVGIEQLLVNAIQNSVDAIVSRRDAGEAELEGEITILVDHNEQGVQMRITDNGTGFDSIDPGSAFGAFITTKPVDKGTGLGLYISRQIVMEMGGHITMESRQAPERGAMMTVDLPAKLVAEPDQEAAA